ncbi:MAG: hypothetical protein IKI76_03950 [Selenomonadaceae bacterium]|nr:hypothetical protein [Selenomonadaceae bacterium]
MSATIKPEIFISWIPTGKVYLKPVIFASIIPTPEKATADSLRQLVTSESINTDTLRQVETSEKFSADTLRTDGREKTSADTCRAISFLEKFSADTERAIEVMKSTSADTFLQIVTSEKAIGDSRRFLPEVSYVNTFRQVTRKEKAIARTVIRIPYIMIYNIYGGLDIIPFDDETPASELPTLIENFKDYGVTSFNVTLSERTLSDTFQIDLAKPLEINGAVTGTLLDYEFDFLVEETSQTDLIQSVKGMYNQDELLYTQFFLDTYKNANEQEYVVDQTAQEHIKKIASKLGITARCLFDNFTPYNLSGRTRITYADLLNSLFGWTSRLPHKQINVFLRGNVLYAVQRGAEINVFDISNLSHTRPTINRKLIRTLWNNPKADDDSDNPDKDNYNDPTIDYQYEEKIKLFSGTISFSDEGCSTSLTYRNGLLTEEKNDSENAKATLSSSVSYGYIEIFPNMSDLEVSIKKGLDKNFFGEFYLDEKTLSSTAITKEDKENPNDPDEYTQTEQYGKTNYRYDITNNGADVYLRSEIENTTTTTYETNEQGTWEETDSRNDVRETFYVPIGNGWYGQSVYQNGAAQGANISQGKPGNRVSQQTIGEVQKILSGWTITYTYDNPSDNPDDDDTGDDDDDTEEPTAEEQYEDWRNKLAPIADISFPVKEEALLKTLTEELLWLNRKIEETVSLDLISKIVNGIPEINHIVDFTERIILDGHEYFLVSNKITFTPRKLIQKLQLIRWY